MAEGEKIEDGGEAFPLPGYSGPSLLGGTLTQYPLRGMSLRDYFAAAAMQALASRTDHMCGPVDVASDAYQYADALLAARKAGKP